MYVRVPGWSKPDAVVSVNGKRVLPSVEPASFAAIRRTWKDGDRIELEFPMPLRLEAVDEQHADLVALLRGPLVLFAVADAQPQFDRAELLRARAANNDAGDWLATSADGSAIAMRPFMTIQKEKYSTYVRLKS